MTTTGRESLEKTWSGIMALSAMGCAWLTARAFGMISPKKRTRRESTTIAVARLWVGISFVKRRAAVADVATLMNVFPNRIVESSSRGRWRALTMSCGRLDLSWPKRLRCTRFRLNKAVSVAEK